MDLIARILVRMALWVRRPPSRQWIYMAVAALALAVVISGLEWLDLWPDWARTERLPRRVPY